MGAGVGLQLKAPTGERIEQTIRLDFASSNNETKYEAILTGVDLGKSVSSEKLIIRIDSQLVVAGKQRIRNTRPSHGQVCKSGQTTIRELFSLEAQTYPEGLE